MNDSAKIVPGAEIEIEQMARYEITCVPIDQFHYRSYRYSNLGDALAQAKRDAMRV